MMKDKGRLRTCFRLIENKEKWQLNAMCDLRLNPVLKEENAIKLIIEYTDKIQTGP